MSSGKERLPQVDRARVQSSESVSALREVIREPLFIPREPTPDYGVDFLAEVLTDERNATNWHLAIQLRSQDPPRFVEQGTAISVRFKTSALNYLFRGVGRSIVVAYDVVGKRLYWQWTDRVVDALDSASQAWRDQETVTVHVPTHNILTRNAADAIRRDVLMYHQRASAAQAAVLVAGETAKAGANTPDTLAAIRKGGTGLVTAGLHREVLTVLQRVPEADWFEDTAVVLTIAYAYERSGSPLQAFYYANLIADDAPRLDDDDKALIACIRSNAKMALGQIEAEAHWDELRAVGERFPGSFVAAQAALTALSAEAVLASKHKSEREEIVNKVLGRARSIVAAHKEETYDNRRGNWALDVLLAEVEAEVVDQLILSRSIRIRIADDMRAPIPLVERLAMARDAIGLFAASSKRLQAVMEESRAAGEAQWEAIAHLTFLESQLKRFGLFVAIGVPEEDDGERQKLLEGMAETAEQMAVEFTTTDHRGLALRAKRLQGGACAMQSDEAGVAKVRDELERWTRQLGLRPEAALITGPFRPPNEETDEHTLAEMWADENPEFLSQMEDSVMQSLALPEERRPALQRDIQATQRAHREQLDHCRHFLVLQDLRHTQSRATYYEQDPGRVGSCELLGYESQIEDTDVNAIIDAFKRAYCSDCSRREPFNH